MNLKKITVIAASTIVVIVLILVIAVIFLSSSGHTPNIELPDASNTSGIEPTGDITGGDDWLLRAEVNTDTVKAVIETLERPPAYGRSFQIESFWVGGSTIYYIDIFAKKNETRIIIDHRGYEIQNVKITDKKVYTWYNNENVKEVNRWKDEDILQDVDGYQMLLTYEDILKLDEKSIVAADYREKDGKYFIYVESKDELMGYLTSYYISIESGLLAYAEKKDGENTIYKMTLSDEYLSQPPDQYFELP